MCVIEFSRDSKFSFLSSQKKIDVRNNVLVAIEADDDENDDFNDDFDAFGHLYEITFT